MLSHDSGTHQILLSMAFSRQEYWSGLLCSSLGDLPYPGTEPRSPILQADSLLSEPLGKPWASIISAYQEELPHVWGQGQWPRVLGCDGAGTARRSHPESKVGATVWRSHPHSRLGLGATRSHPASEVRDSSREDRPTTKKRWLCWRRRA